MLLGKSEGTHHRGELSSEEFWRILDLMAERGSIKPRDVHPEILDYRNIITVRRACYVANIIWSLDRSSLGSVQLEELVREAAYAITPRYVSKRLKDFEAWLNNRSALNPGDNLESLKSPVKPISMIQLHRVEQILSYMWVPHPDHVPLKVTHIRDGLHVEDVGGRQFRWEQTEGAVSLSWVDNSAQWWLRDRIFCGLSEGIRKDVEAEWRELQELMCNYLEDAKDYNFSIDNGWGEYTVLDVERMIFPEVERMILPDNVEGFRRAQRLSAAYPRLREKVTQFKELLLNATYAAT